jgi:integrase
MPLTVRKIASLRRPGKYPDGGNLYLQINPNGARSWLFRYMRDGRDRAMGLGPVDLVSLAEARHKAIDLRRQLLAGIDPLGAKRSSRSAARLAAAGKWTFRKACEEYIGTKAAGWKNPREEIGWRNEFANHTTLIAEADVATITTEAIVAVLEPIWQAKPVLAKRLLQRMHTVFLHARARGKRRESSPADPDVLAHLLPEQRHQPTHFAAVPIDDLPAAMTKLRADPRITAKAAEFAILTAARPAMVTGALWSEVDLSKKVWTIPGGRMKKPRDHRVPLSKRALEILAELPRDGDFVFGGERPLPDRSLAGPFQKAAGAAFTVHGSSRSSFQDWAEDVAGFEPDLVELALAHAVKGVRKSYRRGDALDRRIRLMDRWAAYCGGEPMPSAEVIELALKKAG